MGKDGGSLWALCLTVLGASEGEDIGRADGACEGCKLGARDGIAVGLLLGSFEGRPDGSVEGLFVGALEGMAEGDAEGVRVGAAVSAVHTKMPPRGAVVATAPLPSGATVTLVQVWTPTP